MTLLLSCQHKLAWLQGALKIAFCAHMGGSMGGMGMCSPGDPPFHPLPLVHKDPIWSKSVSSQDPVLRKFGNFSLYSLNFCPNFQLTSPQFGNFQFTSPLFQKQVSVRKPHTLEIRAAHPYLKESWVPPSPTTDTEKKNRCFFFLRMDANWWLGVKMYLFKAFSLQIPSYY